MVPFSILSGIVRVNQQRKKIVDSSHASACVELVVHSLALNVEDSP